MTNHEPQTNELPDFADSPTQEDQTLNTVDSTSDAPVVATAAKKSSRGERQKVQRSVAGSTWVALIAGILLLIVLLVFILQNQESAEITFLAWTLNFPIGVGMLIAAIIGALVMALVGGVRIIQLRRQVTHR